MSEALQRRLAALSPERVQDLLAQLAENGAARPAPVATMPREPGRRYPLSSAQERIWFLCRLAPESRVFNNPAALRCWVREPFDRARLEWSLGALAQRHEILRTTFHSDAGRPVQLVHDEMPLSVECVDLRALPRDEREREATRVAYEEGRQAFDLTTGPLVALKLVRLDELEYLLLQTTHHIVSDGWSNAMFSKELPLIYEAGPAGSPPLPPVELHYLDYVQWEQRWLESEQFDRQLAYWKHQLAEEREPLPLPADRPRPAAASHAGGVETLTLRPELADALRSFARRERASLFQTLVSGLMALLHRYSGEEVITVGTSTANRNRREFQGVMGPFNNTLALRASADPELPFRAFVQHVRSVCQDALAHQDLPFEKLIGELKPPRQPSAHPVFQVMFVHQNVPSLYEVAGTRLEVLKIDYGVSKFDLNLWAEEIGDELRLALHYSRDLFEPATARRMLLHLEALLTSAVSDPECALGRLPYFDHDPAVRDSGPALDSDPEAFHLRFEAAARRFADVPAVECRGESLTYRELNAAANRLARHLVGRGIGREEVVAVLAPRTPQSLIAVLAIMKAGGAYLPLDATHPPARLSVLLEDSGARIAITAGDEARAAAAALTGVDLLDLDRAAEEIARQDGTDLGIEVEAGGLAYLIYTSGTTGRPKGVMVEHRNLVSYADAVWDAMALDPGERFATVSALAADLGNTMIFPPLEHGGCVVMVAEDAVLDAAALAAEFNARPVDCMKIVPSHLSALLDSPHAAALLPRRLLVLGGEACPAQLVRRVRDHATGCRILNHYGPTETTVGVLTYDVPEPEDATGGGSVALGFPLPGARVYVLDAAGRRVPSGIPGEIYIGGAGVARGYLNRPELDAERFVASPFVPGERLYRTGDRARRRADGAIEFLGRSDRQVKVHGFRVELAEVEHALTTHPDVAQAVVTATGQPARPLAAHVRTRAGATLSADSLRRHLAARLPSQAIPGAFVFVDAFPMTPAGKLDVQALPAADAAAPAAHESPARDWLELELAYVWEDVLGLGSVGVHDDFFELGGHSLLAVQLMARIEERFDRALPLAALFEQGSVAGLAELIRSDPSAVAASPLVPIQRRGRHAPLAFVHPAGGNVLCYQALSNALGPDVPFFGLQATPSAGTAAARSIGDLARAYKPAVLALGAEREPLLGGWSMGALVAFEVACLLEREDGRAPAVAVLDQVAPGAHGAPVADDELSRLERFAAKVSEFVGADLEVARDELAQQSADEQAAAFLERFKEHQLAPASTTTDEFRGFLDLMLAHNRMTVEYEPSRYAGKVVVLRAARDDDPRPSDLGWQRHCAQQVEVVEVPGTHVSMMKKPAVEALAERLGEWMAAI